MRALRIALVGASLLIGLVAFSSPAGATKYVGNCSVSAIQPAAVSLSAGGVKTSAGRANVYCSTNRTVQVNVQLYGADTFSNDLLVSQTWTGTAGPSGVTVSNGRVACNEDVGGDELFSNARVRIYTNGIWSAWSAWDQGVTYAFSC